VWAYLVGYGFIRFWVELLRTDTVERYLGLSRNNWAALVAFLAGLVLLRWWQRRTPFVAMGTPIPQPASENDAGEAAQESDDQEPAEPTDGDGAGDQEPSSTSTTP
jgi:hypothetical protein